MMRYFKRYDDIILGEISIGQFKEKEESKRLKYFPHYPGRLEWGYWGQKWDNWKAQTMWGGKIIDFKIY